MHPFKRKFKYVKRYKAMLRELIYVMNIDQEFYRTWRKEIHVGADAIPYETGDIIVEEDESLIHIRTDGTETIID